ncbi:MAG: hypothetical protein ABS949_11780 [Solibacillus sp.]
MPLKPIALKNNVGTSFHVEILAPTDMSLQTIVHVMAFFENIYPAQRYEMSMTNSEAMKSNYVSVCFVEGPKN